MFVNEQFLELLNAEKIHSVLEPEALQRLLRLEIFTTVDSTNTYLLSQSKSGVSGWFCFAEQQTAGRGRLGRTWFSPYGANIYCSLLWQFNNLEEDLSGLSIAVAVMLANVCKKYGVCAGIELKWPNDLLFNGRKFSGILIERSGPAVVIGVGINLHLCEQAESNWIALDEITGKPIARNYFAGLLVNELLQKIPLYQARGLAPFIREWRHYDYLIGKNITVQMPTGNISGVMQGINEQGELLLLDEQGDVRHFRYGEVSVRDGMQREHS
jgi:BirA family biotin operon repressor/biotin-[acetyl-CoA-carboxylase] ligase